jgi:hypothetical protein
MKIHEYNEMMSYLTRRPMSNGGLSTVTANIRGKPVTYQRKSKLGQIDTKRRNIIKQFILDDIENFEKNLRKFPDEKYQLNKTKIVERLRDNNINTSKETVDDVIKSISPKDKKRFSVIEIGQSSLSSLSDAEQDLFAKNYKAKTISQMATEITGKPYDNKITKAKSAQLYRHYLSQIKLGNIAAEDVPRGTRPKGTVPEKELKTFENYRKAQKQLMNLDPKTYKDLTPSMLDNRIKKALQFSTVRGAFDVPQSLTPSFEHFQGLVPSTIIQDPKGLRKAGITTKDYNFNVMGAKAKNGMYKTVKNNIRTAKEFLDKGNTVEAKKSLGVVNEIYDDIAKKLKYVDRKKLPKYSLGKEGIRETNLKTVDIGTEKRLGNTIEEYIRFVAAGPKKDVAKIKQPNLAKAVEMVQKGEDKAVKELVKSRLTDVKGGELFGGIPLAPLGKAALTAAEVLGTPAAAALFATDTVRRNIREGQSLTDAIVDPMVGAELLFPSIASKAAPGVMRGVLGLGRVGRAFTPVGAALAIAGQGQEFYNQYKALQELKEQNPRAYEEFMATRVTDPLTAEELADIEDMGREGAMYGGRVGFAEGPKDPSRRKFIKIMGGLASLPVVGKYFKFAEKVAPVVQQLKNTTTTMPEWFPSFIDKVINRGVGKKIDADLMEYEVKELPGIKVTKSDDGRVFVEGQNDYYKSYEIDYTPPGYEVIDEKTGKVVKRPGDFMAQEDVPVNVDPDGNADFDNEVLEDLDQILGSDTRAMEEFATGKPVKGMKSGEFAVGRAEAQADAAKDFDDFYED